MQAQICRRLRVGIMDGTSQYLACVKHTSYYRRAIDLLQGTAWSHVVVHYKNVQVPTTCYRPAIQQFVNKVVSDKLVATWQNNSIVTNTWTSKTFLETFEDWSNVRSHFCIYCRSNWSVPQILIQYITSGWPIHFIKFLEIFIHFLWRSQFQEFDHFGHFLSIYDWLVAQTTKVIGAFKLFNRKFTIILGSVWISRGTW
jgi:hypothetical protein